MGKIKWFFIDTEHDLWDLDISFAGWPLGGNPEEQMKLSLSHPHSSDEHKLIDRLLSIESVKLKYDNIIDQLIVGLFSKKHLGQDL